MMNRRNLLLGIASAVGAASVPRISNAQSKAAPSALRIERSLDAAPRRKLSKAKKIHRRDLRRRSDIRRIAPSIDIQAINFEFGSSYIPNNEYWKVENIAQAMRRILRRRDEVFLIEGHTDAVGSRYNNQLLSERRAQSLKNVLVRHFYVDPRALETAGFGEDYLLVRTQRAEWRNRRVTLRRVTDLILR